MHLGIQVPNLLISNPSLIVEFGKSFHNARVFTASSCDNNVKAATTMVFSNHVCQIIEAEGIIDPLANTLKHLQTSESLIEKILNLLARILDLSKEMKSKFYDGPVNGSKKLSDATKNPEDFAVLTGNMVDKPISNVNAKSFPIFPPTPPPSKKETPLLILFC
ncbi:hypothetical protein CMV_017594 [Castanea mollissima]|uniref:Uncharacterized protein n=1 Tax=Castanea mollissima TaxID=60419 RepID=A0A8J4QS56_9ROSI|nr:hypothetical protein CMV_017594 [Castanea mollissima]